VCLPPLFTSFTLPISLTNASLRFNSERTGLCIFLSAGIVPNDFAKGKGKEFVDQSLMSFCLVCLDAVV
jgi:hypothetical protein